MCNCNKKMMVMDKKYSRTKQKEMVNNTRYKKIKRGKKTLFQIKNEDHTNLVIHSVFFTRQLPQITDCPSLYGMLVQFTCNYLPTLKITVPGLKSIQNTMEMWGKVQNTSVSDIQISKALHAMQPGQTFAIFVRPHNSVITIKRSEKDPNVALMSVFRVSANNKMVMSEGDLFHTFPERAVWIPFSRFLYKAFAIQVAILCNQTFEGTFQNNKKAEVAHPDSSDVAEPIFIISWLLGAISGTMQGAYNFACVQKVIRDDVLSISQSENPWRRSGEWFAIKCVLHIMLVTELGSVEGTVIYKSLMIYVMVSFIDDLPSLFNNNDVIMQMLSKVSRQMAKLENYINTKYDPTTVGPNGVSTVHPATVVNNSLFKRTAQWVAFAFKKAHLVLRQKRIEADKRWNNHIKACCESLLNTSEFHTCDHIIHNLTEVADNRLKQVFQEEENNLGLPVEIPPCVKRWENKGYLFDKSLLVYADKNDCLEILWDFEFWVKNTLWENFEPNIPRFVKNNIEIFDLLCSYFEISYSFYANDPVGSSRMILTMLLIIAGLDSIAVKEWPLLSEYHSSFDENYFDCLIIPRLDEMKYLQAVRKYFITRNMKSIYRCIMAMYMYDDDSFGSRIANETYEMQKKRTEILLYMQEQRDMKKKEFEEEKKRYDQLMHEYYNLSHTTDKYGHCVFNCSKCNKFSIAFSMKIYEYEDPVPEEEWKQNAIVFELSLPVRIRCLRDSLFIFHKRLTNKQFEDIKIWQPWISHPQLLNWASSECKKAIVSIGSTTFCKGSWYNYINKCPRIEHYLLPCGLNINQFMKHKNKCLKLETAGIKSKHLKQKLYTIKAWRNPYEINLEWIAKTTHTENDVLASQVNCPLNLRLDEFKVFGSLRAGHRLQLRKILRTFEMHSLSFENSSVYALIAQALWQVGPGIKEMVNDPVLFFESHYDLRNDGFCLVLIDCLSTFLENISENWKKHSQLQLVIILALRMFSLSSEKVRVRVTILLKRCRSVAQTWAAQIENLLSGIIASNLSEINEARLKLIDVAAFTALTFDIDEYHESVINKETLCSWLQAVSCIHDNILLSNSSLDFEKRNLLRRVKLAALHLETIAVKILALNSSEIFNKFLSFKWPDFSKGVCKSCWVPYTSPGQTWYHNEFKISEYRSVTLQINILSGKFLVDGNPIGKLPEIITKSQDYERVFNQHIFEVRPAAEKSDSFVSVHAIRGSVFTFSFRKHGLVVVERRTSGDEYELIPFNIFSEHLPYFFVNKYSHWVCKQTKVIFFRPIQFNDPKFFNAEHDVDFSFKFDLQKRTLYDFERKRYLVDIQSDTFNNMYSCTGLKRIEQKKYIHLWLKETNEKNKFELNVELPRMDLFFKFEEKTGKLISREYNGLIVSQLQGGFGTLIGLKNGLLLCEDAPLIKTGFYGQRKVLILPHTKNIKLAKSEFSNHQIVKIKLAELSSPAYFAYDIDDRICELRGPANLEAWLYLSLLHAMTSSSLPDPFTKLTGTESSMRLLQIGRTFSCKPLEQSALGILKFISKLAPKRKYNLKSQTFRHSVTWFQNLLSTYAFDGLGLASKILRMNADEYNELFQTPNDKLPDKRKRDYLKKRAYWRYKTQLNSCAHLEINNERSIGGIPKRRLAWEYLDDDKIDNEKSYRLLMECCYQWNGIQYISSNLWDVVKKNTTINKINLEVSTVSSFFALSECNLIDSYLYLYELAQNVYEEKCCRFEFSLMLSLLSFIGENKDLLFSLLAVAILGINVQAPALREYEYINQTDFDLEAIHSAIKNETLSLDSFTDQYNNERKKLYRQIIIDKQINYTEKEKINTLYESSKTNALTTLGEIARLQWSSRRINFNLKCNDIVNIYNLELEINKLFTRWDNNGKLKRFFDEVEMSIKMKQLYINTHGTINNILVHSFSNPKINTTCQEPYNLKITIKNLPENQVAVDLFRNKSSATYNKTCGNSVRRKNQSEEVLSLFDIPDNNNDALFEFMKGSIETSCNDWSKNDLLSLEENEFENNVNVFDDCHKCLLENNRKSRCFWGEVSEAMKPQANDIVGHALFYGGLWRRITPVVVVPCILPLSSFYRTLLLLDSKDSVPKSIVDRVGALIVCWTTEQKAIRCIKMHQNNSPPAILLREIKNEGHENWIPSSYPEWLVLELEGNFLIRPIQIDIAQSMLDANENFVQQLNMGEGKTSVIVPLLAVSLATSEQLARVTVLRSLLNTNYEALVDKLGGLLNKRVYIVPCRRDLILDPSKVFGVYQKCLNERGLMLTTPEYRLSLDLKTLEHCRKNSDDAEKLYKLRCWLRKHTRDVLDEADEILNVKYQLVYTLGEQMFVDGREYRWIISQAILRLVNKFAENLLLLFGEEYIDYHNYEARADSFSRIQLLSSNTLMYKHLCGLIADSVLNNEIPEVSVAAKLEQSDKTIARIFITSNDISIPKLSNHLSKLFETNSILKTELLILRGLLSFEVLHLALQKRWRVHFGVNLMSTATKMAVPFRAKDVAAERTEFGHPDTAIILTQISYYMSGLNDDQLDEVFNYLDKCSNKDVEYERWIEAIGTANVPIDLRVFNGVNLDNIEQKVKLYSILRYSMNVINFWLNRAVYPREAKQFPYRISTSAWDLCLSKDSLGNGIEKCTTGFSGTNESELLLPLTIKSNNLPQTQGTNAMVLSYLLQSENNAYYHFDSGMETLDVSILEKIVETNARVLIDVGALMLQMDNKSVGQKWLQMVSSLLVSAAVFFDKDDRLMVIDRKGCISPFSISPYSHQLDHCVFYIDDFHTRGTDLKFPFGTLACVTLGKGLTKDRLIQACMRMRLLGHGHRVYFCAANDVHLSIVKQIKSCSNFPGSGDILRWAISNSCNAIRDGLLHWSSQGLRRATKEAAESLMHNTKDRILSDKLKELGTMCTEDEIFYLHDFYGESRLLESVSNIFRKTLDKRVENFNNYDSTCKKIIMSIGEGINSRCNQFVSTYKRFANALDEEQERELEVELEEECHIERPGVQSPHKPKLSREVINLVEKGIFYQNSLEILTIDNVFKNTNRLLKLFPKGCWSPGLMVTKEFTMVIEDNKEGDDFLFEISWIIIVPLKNHSDHTRCVLISSYEVNELLPIFRSVQNCAANLHMFAPRLRRGQNIFINQNNLILPESKLFQVDDNLVSQLSVLGGGLFFLTSTEQDAYCKFVRILENSSEQNELKQSILEIAIEILHTRGRCMQTTSSHVCQLLYHRVRNQYLE